MASLTQRTGALGSRLAAHLLRRTTYSYNSNSIDEFSTLTAEQAVDSLFAPITFSMEEPIDWETMQPWLNSGVPPVSSNSRLRFYIMGWWLNEARQHISIHLKMMFFLHSNFIVHAEARGNEYFFDYLSLIKLYTTGSFKELALKITNDNIMMEYLDNAYNTKWNPNENYAREFLELFTIGKGPQIGPGNYTNYTEDDVAEAAKLLTGWRFGERGVDIDPDTGITAGYADYGRHDLSVKTFSTAFGSQSISPATDANDMLRELSEFVDMVFAQEETAKAIVRKLYRFFVSRHITEEIELDIIAPLAETLRGTQIDPNNWDYQLEPMLKELFKSEHFFEEDGFGDGIIGGLMKSPLESLLPLLTFLDLEIPDPLTNSTTAYDHYHRFWFKGVVDNIFDYASLDLFRPPSVAGYQPYYQEPVFHRFWFNSSYYYW